MPGAESPLNDAEIETNRFWVAEMIGNEGPYADGIRAAARWSVNAVPDKRAEAFENGLTEALICARAGNIDAQNTIDIWQEIANKNGLVAEITHDGVQNLIA